jgi:outer membrane protein assembly factor BamA
MIHPVKIFLLSVLLIGFIFPQTIKTFEITENTDFTESDIQEWSGISTGLNYFPGLLDSVRQNIAKQLAGFGYLNPDFSGTDAILANDSSGVSINLNVNQGDPTFINNIFFDITDSSGIEKVNQAFDFLKGQIFNKYDVEESISGILTDLENSGYPFGYFQIESLYLYDDTLENKHLTDLQIRFDEGRKSTIDKVQISGNSSTKDYVIIRELRINEGEEYSQQRVEDFPKRLNKLRFFDPVPVPQFYLDKENKGVLLITVKEKNTNSFDGIIGYVPPSSDKEKGYVTGLVNVTLRNIFGTGRAASVKWQKLTRESQELDLKYLEPWLFGYPFNVNVGLFQRIQDSTYVQRKFGGSLEYLATEDISASGSVLFEDVIPTVRTVPVFTVYNSSTLTTGLDLKIDLRDDPLSPTSGVLFLTGYSFSRKKISGPAEYITPTLETNVNLQRITASFSFFYELFLRNVIAISVNGRELRGPFFEISDLWKLGGTSSVRGYREEQFLASRVAWTNLEYRFLLTRRSYAFLFFDSGYYLREADPERGIQKSEDVIYGYGLGITVETGIGLLGVSFGLAQGDSFSDGKIHFGIINEF